MWMAPPHPANLAELDDPAHRPEGQAVARGVCADQNRPGLLALFDHLLRFSQRDGHGLLHQHVLPMPRSRNGVLGVKAVG